LDPEREHDDARLQFLAVVDRDDLVSVAFAERDGPRGHRYLDAELLRLQPCAFGKLGA
jgi:hypothetical protein